MSNPVQLKLRSSNEIVMALSTEGDIKAIDEIKLHVNVGDYSFAFEGVVVDDQIKLNIPKMAGILEAGEYQAKLDIVADGDKHFSPFSGLVEFVSAGDVSISESEVTEIKDNSDIKVEIEPQPVEEVKGPWDEVDEDEVQSALSKYLKERT